jgi:hypothetical protein
MAISITTRVTRQPISALLAEPDPLTIQRRVVERLTRQLGISTSLAATIAGLAGLGPEEARHG